MATKSEIREWLEACGAKGNQLIVYLQDALPPYYYVERVIMAPQMDGDPVHLLNELVTGIQGPTFAEWQKQKGREGKVEKIAAVLEESHWYDHRNILAKKILDAIEGEQ